MKTKASVKVMRSYDYNHFEVVLSTDQAILPKQVNQLRVEAAKLVERAISDYKKFKEHESGAWLRESKRKELEAKAKVILENTPKSEWTSEQKAIVKAFKDREWDAQFEYDEEWP